MSIRISKPLRRLISLAVAISLLLYTLWIINNGERMTIATQAEIPFRVKAAPFAAEETTSKASNLSMSDAPKVQVIVTGINAAQQPESRKAKTELRTAAAEKVMMISARRTSKVKEMMLHGWNNYMLYAKGADELISRSKSPYNWNNDHSLLLTPIDAFDTLWLMNLHVEAKAAQDLIFEKLTLSIDTEVSVFETTIRVLGGLLSAYDLQGDKKWLSLAVELGDRLLPAFGTPHGLPIDSWNLLKGAVTKGARGMLSQAGSIQIEFEWLSARTKDPKYKNAVHYAKKALKVWDTLSTMKRPIDGLIPTYFDIDSATFSEFPTYSLSAGSDSFYEYLLKYSLITGEKKYRKMYDSFTIDAQKHIVKTFDREDIHRVWTYDTGLGSDRFHHLSCFAGAMFALGEHTNNQNNTSVLFKIGQDITETCYESYSSSLTGLGGEFVIGHVMDVGTGAYALRPETVESLFYMWRLTKDNKYREWGWEIVKNLENHCRDENGYHPIGHDPDTQMSFFFSETLKYLFLLFSDDDVLPLDKFVFTTEGHVRKLDGNDPARF